MKTFAAIALTAAALAGCGSSSSGGGGSTSNASASASGPTLYTFAKDTTGKSNCSGACAKNWPPAASAPGLDKGKITKIKRADGAPQVALNGHPLYRFSGDKQPGDAKGDGVTAFGGVWTAATPHAAAPAKPSRSYGY
jgi:predicted lipoprotein with Yx(FWY)xxD motif